MTSPIGSFAGIGSGFDYTSLVNSIMQAASQPAIAMQHKIDTANTQVTAYNNFQSLLNTFDTAAKSLRNGSAFSAANVSIAGGIGASGNAIVSATAAVGADPGSYAVQVTQTAQAEKLSGSAVAGSGTALGYSGDFMINNKVIAVIASDTLSVIRDKINAANTGATPSGVSAAIISDSASAQRLVLTSQSTGGAGINLVDGAQGLARQLGWLDTSASIKHTTSAGAQSDQFASASATIASQLGLSASSGAQTVTIAGQAVSIDLGSDSLTSIAAKVSAVPGVQATVQSTTVNGVAKYSLDIRNTTNFVDAGHTLEQLGVLIGGRSAITQQLRSVALTAGDASTPAAASTLLANVWNGGSASGAQTGDTLTVSGTRGDGSVVNLSVTIGAGTTVQDLLDQFNNTTDGFGAGTRPATASIDASGYIVVIDGKSGGSTLSLQIVAHNESGGRLDLSTFDTVSRGRARQLVQGADAKFTVDGVPFTRASNTVSDVIANTTLSLTSADPNTTATVTVSRDVNGAQTAVQGFVRSYNQIIDFIQQQQTAAASGSPNPALYNDSLLRLARSSLSSTILHTVANTAPGLSTAGMAGVSLTKDGHLSLDTDKFAAAFNTQYSDLEKLFTEQGTSTNAAMVYTSSTVATHAGTYDIHISRAATHATVNGTGFSGTYTNAGTPDTMVVDDLATHTSTQISLTDGMTAQQIVDALNSAFASAHPAISVTASTVGGQVTLTHNAFGAVAGMHVSFIGGSSDATAQLGIATGDAHGLDVAGTIGGYAATGSGTQLVGNTGTPVDGLSLVYLGTTTGAIGSLSLAQGIGYAMDQLVTSWTDSATGSIARRGTSLNHMIATQQHRITDFNARMDVRRQSLLKQYLAMDTAVQKFNQHASALTSIFKAGSSNSTSGG